MEPKGKVTIKDVAREAGVSVPLVSRVLNARKREDGTLDCDISQTTAERVFRVVRELDYRPNRSAVALTSGKRDILGVITPDISNYAFSEAGRHVEELAHQDGYSVMFGSSNEQVGRLGKLLDLFYEHRVDGLIVTPCPDSQQVLQKIVSKGVPTVLIYRDIPRIEGVGRVFHDNFASMKMVVDHLYLKGYRNIAMISEAMDVVSLRDRERGYAETMLSHDLIPYIRHAITSSLKEDVFRFIREAVATGTEAVITPRIMLSLYSMQAASEMGLRIPDNLAIFGHDESPAFWTHNPPVPYVSQSSDIIGKEAYKMLRSMISGADPDRILIRPEVSYGSLPDLNCTRMHG